MRLLPLSVIFLFFAEITQAQSTGLLRNGWRQAVATLAAVGVIYGGGAMLPTRVMADPNFPPPPNAQAQPEWRLVFARSFAQHRSVFHLRTDLLGENQIEHLVYLGSNREKEGTFISMRPLATSFAHDYRKLLGADIKYSLYAWDGLVQEDVRVKQEHIFLVPDLDFYDVAIIKIEGMDFTDVIPVRLAGFPRPDTHLNLVSYLPTGYDLVDQNVLVGLPPPVGRGAPEPELDLSLYWQRCHAGTLVQGLLGDYSCASDNIFTHGAAVFKATTGDLVGFYFSKLQDDEHRGVVKIKKALHLPHEALRYDAVSFTVSPVGKLPTRWGKIKGEVQ